MIEFLIKLGVLFSKLTSSTTAQKIESSSSIKVKDLLECPICLTFMYPPIHQCCNGHAICFTCKGRVDNKCPICRKKLGNIRCIALEKLAEFLEIPCKFHEFGCQCTDSYCNRLSHEEICRFRPYSCPYSIVDECSVTGDIGSLVSHLTESHCVHVHAWDNFKCKFMIPEINEFGNGMWNYSIFYRYGHQFLMHFETSNTENTPHSSTPVYMAFLRFMGDESEAAKFRYCLEVGGKERKMTWQGIPRSIRESVTSIRDNVDGLIIQKKNVELFFSNDGLGVNLEVYVRIWKKENSW